MQEISCIFCGKRNDDVVISENGYSGVKCSECDLIYISPRPGAEDIAQLYTDDHASLYADAQFKFDSFNEMEAARALLRIQPFKSGGTILELGAGGGCFLSEARKFGYEPYGIELNPIEARWITDKLKIPCESTELSKDSFGGKQFDVIYLRDVLSHLFDPIKVYGEINRALKEDGVLVFETGNTADVHLKYFKYFAQYSYPDHLFFFGEKSISKLLERTGFRSLRIHRDSILLFLLLQKMLWGVKDSLKDGEVVDEMKSRKQADFEKDGMSLKRRLRLCYRYIRHYLVRIGSWVLPKRGRPLKLIVIAEKDPSKTLPGGHDLQNSHEKAGLFLPTAV